MGIKGVSDEEAALLSDEERAGLEEGDKQDDEDAADLKAIAGEKGPGDEEDDDDEDDARAAGKDADEDKKDGEEKDDKKGKETDPDKDAGADKEKDADDAGKSDKSKGADAGKDAGKDAAAAGDDEEEEVQRPRLPRYEVKQVEKYDEQVKALDDADEAAVAKFKEGNLELPDLLKARSENEAKRTDLREAKLRADMANEFNTNAEKTEWMGDVQDFFARTKAAEGIDYNKPLLNAAFDKAVRALGAEKANEQRSATWFLREAHKQVMAELGVVAKPADKGDKPGDKGGKKPEGRKPALAVVKDVGSLPNAGEDDAAGGNPEFASLDKLEGMELEDALAAMPPAKQDRYLRSTR